MAKRELPHKEMRSIMSALKRERERNEESERKASNERERLKIEQAENLLAYREREIQIKQALSEAMHLFRVADYKNREAILQRAENLLQSKGIDIKRKALEVYHNGLLQEIDKKHLDLQKKAFQLHIDESVFRLYHNKAIQELAIERMKFDFVQMIYEEFKTLDKKELELNFRDQNHRNKVAQHELNVLTQNYKWDNLQNEMKMRYEQLKLERKGLQQEQFRINLQKEFYANTNTWGNLNYMMQLEQTEKFLKQDIQKLSSHLANVLSASGYNNLNEFLMASIETK